jgi:hypothetical protein
MPFVVAVALVGLLAWRVDLRAFARAFRSVNVAGYVGFCVAFLVANLAADSLATAFVYRRTVCGVSARDFFLIRGASYLPSLLNHHVGQAWLTWYVARAFDAPLWRVAGATLLVYATTFGSLFVFGAVALLFDPRETPWLGPTMLAGTLAGLAYLGVVYAAPARLARRQLLAPLFELGVRGHLEALALRLVHTAVLFLGSWLPFYFFGVRIPAQAALAYVPVLMFLVALPITPQGVGTRDWFCLAFFARFAAGEPSEREAAVAATTLSFAVAIALVSAVFSPVLMQRALRSLDARKKPSNEQPTANS